ncbi:MAG: DUF565 domain-containing protein [Hydrococcus sp. Prado102]|jgi:hypothetical protein|nr:DUF565 domain-containing protein [Hydrococcus sp. Prado102]
MQRTRLNTLLDGTGARIDRFFENPWRRFSLIVISLLFGFFAGAGISTTAGQAAEWDIVVAGLILFFTEVISRFVYTRNWRSLFVEILNFFKIGVSYSLFLEAFKLGS